MPLSTKTFVLSTSALNSKGFRTLTSGAQLDNFIANPLMYWLHMEPEGKSKDEPMPIGFWENIRKEGDEILAQPNFDDSDEFAMSIYHKVEHGTIRAASIEVEPIQLNADKTTWVKGQKLPTVEVWTTGEASICDRGSNKGAIVKLKNKGKVVTLSEHEGADAFFQSLQTPQDDNMKIKLNKKASKALKLAEETELDATEVVEKLVEVIEDQNGTIKLKEEKVTELEGTITTMEKTAKTEKIKLMVEKAGPDGDRKITKEQMPKYIKLAEGDFEGTEDILNSMTGAVDLSRTETRQEDKTELASLERLSYQQLDKEGKLHKLKEISLDTFKLKFKERYGTEYKGK